MKFAYCFCYLAFLGIVFHFIGEALPREIFNAEKFPFCEFPFEKGGVFYEHLGIRRWKNKLPDMSLLLRDMAPKRLGKATTPDDFDRLISETCIAEAVHIALSLLGIPCFYIWRGAGGAVVFAVWLFLGNLPYMMIQRYNRPRLSAASAKFKAVYLKKN